MTRRSRLPTTPRSSTTRACRGMSRQAPSPGTPQKAPRQRVEHRCEVPQHDLCQGACRRRAHHLRGQTLPHGQRCRAPHQGRHRGSRDGDGVRLAPSPRCWSSSAASFRCTELVWQHLKPIMSNEFGLPLSVTLLTTNEWCELSDFFTDKSIPVPITGAQCATLGASSPA